MNPRRWAWLARPACVLLLALAAPPALADCVLPDSAPGADSRLRAGQDCQELDRFTLSLPEGPRTVRVIADEGTPAAWREALREVRRGLQQAAAGLRRIGRGSSDELVVLLSGLPPATLEEPEADKAGVSVAGAEGCLIVLYPRTEDVDLPETAVHEFFHCVQYALAPAQMAHYSTDLSGWWIEGTAEWFVHWSLPRRGDEGGFIADFDARSPGEEVTALDYGMVTFFLWYAEVQGAAAVIELMPAMAAGGGRPAQRAAVRSLQDAERWLAFAQAYIDGTLRFPDGRPIPSSVAGGDEAAWTESATQSFRAEPQVLYRAALSFGCGVWEIAAEGEGAWAVSEAPGDWGRLPSQLTVESGGERLFILAGFGAEADFTLTVTAGKTGSAGCGCETLAPAAVPDRCLVGAWQLESGGMLAWLDAELTKVHQGDEALDSYESGVTPPEAAGLLRLEEAGGYRYAGRMERWEEARFGADGSPQTMGSRIVALQESEGLWSAQDGVLQLCATHEDFSATAEIRFPDGAVMTTALPNALPDHPVGGSYRYQCDEGRLALRFELPGLPAMDWIYRRAD